MSENERLYLELLRHLREVANLNSAIAVLEWDMETYMPPGASDDRAAVIAHLTGLAHEAYTSVKTEDLLGKLVDAATRGELDRRQAAVVRKEHRHFLASKSQPAEFVKELADLTARSHHVWVAAKEASDLDAFLPNLSRIVEMQREKASYIGHGASPYDALIGEFDPGITADEVAGILTPLRECLVGLVARIGASPQKPDAALAKIPLPADRQRLLCEYVARKIGFDDAYGRLDSTVHPFMTRLHPTDIRITTAYKADDCLDSLGSTVHEAGHGMFEQSFEHGLHGAQAGDTPSLGLHESQSRLWENLVGKSREFLAFVRQLLESHGALIGCTDEELYRAANTVRPSLIRIEADEVTYNLHVCVRFEIEKALIEGTLDVRDVRDAWNSRYREYLGVEVPDDANGVLQDVHWSAGLFGYFPSYTLGNIYSAQVYESALQANPGLETGYARGDFGPLLEWLTRNLYSHCAVMDTPEAIAVATGRLPDPSALIAYFRRKFGEIYGF